MARIQEFRAIAASAPPGLGRIDGLRVIDAVFWMPIDFVLNSGNGGKGRCFARSEWPAVVLLWGPRP